jgi:hypothetical protein
MLDKHVNNKITFRPSPLALAFFFYFAPEVSVQVDIDLLFTLFICHFISLSSKDFKIPVQPSFRLVPDSTGEC